MDYMSTGRYPPMGSVVTSLAATTTAESSLVTTPTNEVEQQTYYPPGCVEAYERVAQVGEGTYGKVYKAIHKLTGAVVALKRIRMESEKEGFPVTAMREIKLLQHLNHPYVVKLHEIISSKGTIYMVFEYLQHDLTGLLAHPSLKFTPANIKCLLRQLLEGCAYLHGKGILHRDIKGSNLLLNTEGQLKLADFGLARINTRSGHGDLTNRVITLWYRPPELLLGSASYTGEVDIWGIGCIMMELILGRPPFQGQDEPSQLEAIFYLCGSPTGLTPDDAALQNEPADEQSMTYWPGAESLPWWQLMRPKERIPSRIASDWGPYTFFLILRWMTAKMLIYRNRHLSVQGMHLLQKLLALDPAKRMSAKAALQHPYLTQESPAPEPPKGFSFLLLSTTVEHLLMRYRVGDIQDDWHEFDAKARRRRGEIPPQERPSRPPTASRRPSTAAHTDTSERKVKQPLSAMDTTQHPTSSSTTSPSFATHRDSAIHTPLTEETSPSSMAKEPDRKKHRVDK